MLLCTYTHMYVFVVLSYSPLALKCVGELATHVFFFEKIIIIIIIVFK